MSNDKVISYNQSGGITAHTVNVERPQRHIDNNLRNQIRRELPKERPINLTCLLGDSETYQLASEILDFLLSEGFTVVEGGICQSIFSKPVQGLVVEHGEKETLFVVGSR